MTLGQRTFSERSLHGKVAHELGRRIVGGTFAPGDILPNEAAICGELDVSRTALREAFKVLTAKGLISSKPKVGTRVNPRRSWNMLDPDVLAWSFETQPSKSLVQSLFEMRKVFEPAAAEMAATKHNLTLIADLEKAYYDMEAAEVGSQEMFSSDLRFHLALLEATENEFMISLGMMIETALLGSFRISSSLPETYKAALPGHKEVYLGVKMADPERAREAMRQLLLQSNDDALTGVDKVVTPETAS